jgi:UDP-N-acetylmuramyl pentapeptide phosphotransferase/UDP-N-acetylglucosamine-1-phosphate transferase
VKSEIQILFSFILGAFWVYLTIPIVVRVSRAKKLFDFPDKRKVNKKTIPNLGGVSIFIGIAISTLLCLEQLFYPDFRYILAGMIILLFIGIKDDIMVISARKKFIAQLICALILILAGNIRFTNLHGVLGLYEINYVVSIGISLLAIVAIINALNLIDGIDGLATALGVLISVSFGILFLTLGHLTYGILCFAASGSLSMFYFYNVYGKINKIFMGDTGSLIIGLLAAVFVIKYNEFALSGNEQVNKFSPAFSMAIIAVSFFDMIKVFSVRMMKKKSPYEPDMTHIHHKLLRLGCSHHKSTFILMGINLFLIGFVFLFRTFNVNIQLILLVSVSMLLSFVPDFIYSFKMKKSVKSHSVKVQNEFDSNPLVDLIKQEIEQLKFPRERFKSNTHKEKNQLV